MMISAKRMVAIAAGTIMVFAPVSAAAGPSIWVQCDGQPKPESNATTMARLATVTLLGGFGIGLLAAGETATGTAVATGPDGVAACTAALADPALTPFWERRVSILYSRAAHRITTNDTTGALADLQLAREASNGQVPNVLFQRSVAISAQLFEAMLLARAGKGAEAEALAIKAAEARPYSILTQYAALQLRDISLPFSAESERIYNRAVQLDPDSIGFKAARLSDSDDGAKSVAEWERLLTTKARSGTYEGVMRRGKKTTLRAVDGDPLFASNAALANARVGNVARAEELLAGPLLAPLEAQGTQTTTAPEGAANVVAAGRSRKELEEAATERSREESLAKLEKAAKLLFPLTRAIIAEQKGDRAKALQYIQQNINDVPEEVAAVELARRLRANPATSAEMPEFLISSLVKRARPPIEDRTKDVNLSNYIAGLPRFQRVDGGGRYRQAGFWAGIGFKETPIADNPNAISLTFVNGTERYGTDEMLLLRAAELAKARGKTGFIVLRQFSILTYRGYNIDADLDVQFFDLASPPAELAQTPERFLKADEVYAALAPIYIDLPAEIDAARTRR